VQGSYALCLTANLIHLLHLETVDSLGEVRVDSPRKLAILSLHERLSVKNGKILVRWFIKLSSLPEPKLLITDPDPQIENQEFRNWIRLQIRIVTLN